MAIPGLTTLSETNHLSLDFISEVIQVAIDTHEAPTSAAKSSSTTRLLASRFSGDSALP
jgi:hypothetical protein